MFAACAPYGRQSGGGAVVWCAGIPGRSTAHTVARIPTWSHDTIGRSPLRDRTNRRMHGASVRRRSGLTSSCAIRVASPSTRSRCHPPSDRPGSVDLASRMRGRVGCPGWRIASRPLVSLLKDGFGEPVPTFSEGTRHEGSTCGHRSHPGRQGTVASDTERRRDHARSAAGNGVPPALGRRRGADVPRRRVTPADAFVFPAGRRVPLRHLHGRAAVGRAAEGPRRAGARSRSSRRSCPAWPPTWSPATPACTRRTRWTSSS